MRAVIVAHGQPGAPGPQQQAVEELAAAIQTHAPGLTVVGATLAMPGALAAAVRPGCVIYPMFMAEGWFTTRELPRRLAEIGADARVLRPFGVESALPALCIAKARAAAEGEGWDARDTTVLLSAHGSQRARGSANGAKALAAVMAPHFARVVNGFVEEEPFLADAARGLTRAVSLPFFATRADHVTDDLPVALDQAEFTGPRLDPIGLAPEVPALIAASLRAGQSACQ
ncbi:MAG: CbiX/SirB N-terminal domain-containing protein [Paracoccus sp. (in: a-proteobacteria)]|uniref:sirohydrochlorin chelatase n=1 Tax=Paracoccus sp. TaxID=267 RepID=UPI0026DF6BBA|nr:CbiX/SirB N-terminal domain-containing protein [Paracoccus sp. (in: a-proteobacteria)]MDO5630715.1 CbiX/SirB N-terminal domain-containing protein [Paracoccus sp. (in: a-proteobacteria)]